MSIIALVTALAGAISGACQDEGHSKTTITLFPISIIPVLQDEAFQKEVRMTEEQRKKIDELIASNLRAKDKLKSPETMSQSRPKIRALNDAVRKQVPARELREILGHKQYRRAEQILLQSMRYRLFYQQEIVSALRLSKEQTTRVKGIFHKTVEDIQRDMLSGRRRIRKIGDADVKEALWEQMCEVS